MASSEHISFTRRPVSEPRPPPSILDQGSFSPSYTLSLIRVLFEVFASCHLFPQAGKSYQEMDLINLAAGYSQSAGLWRPALFDRLQPSACTEHNITYVAAPTSIADLDSPYHKRDLPESCVTTITVSFASRTSSKSGISTISVFAADTQVRTCLIVLFMDLCYAKLPICGAKLPICGAKLPICCAKIRVCAEKRFLHLFYAGDSAW